MPASFCCRSRQELLVQDFCRHPASLSDFAIKTVRLFVTLLRMNGCWWWWFLGPEGRASDREPLPLVAPPDHTLHIRLHHCILLPACNNLQQPATTHNNPIQLQQDWIETFLVAELVALSRLLVDHEPSTGYFVGTNVTIAVRSTPSRVLRYLGHLPPIPSHS